MVDIVLSFQLVGERTCRKILVSDIALNAAVVPIVSSQEAFTAVVVEIFCQESPDPPWNAHH